MSLNKLKKKHYILLLFIIPVILANAAFATNCPSLNSIYRINNQYSWISAQNGWNGEFAAPTPGKGESYGVGHFLRAEWIKLYDSPLSPGYVQCLYQGNISSEIIKFTQDGAQNSQMPRATGWSCHNLTAYPDVSCICANNDPKSCSF